MLEDRIVNINGEFVPWGEAKVHMMSHSFGRGSAIFEVISVHETNNGPSIFRLDEHAKRMFRTAELLDMALPVTPEEFENSVLDTVKHNGIREGYVKVIGYFPQVAFEILPPQKTLDLAVFVVDPIEDFGGLDFPFENGVSICIPTWRKLDPTTVPIEAKAAANYLNGMVARSEAIQRGFNNAVMLDTQGFIAEGGTESVFLVIDDQLMTPALGTVLPSITRKSLLQAAKALGIETQEGRLKPDYFFEAQEIFLTGTPMKVLPVKKIEDRVLDKVPGPIAQRLASLMSDLFAGRDHRFKDWLFPVG